MPRKPKARNLSEERVASCDICGDVTDDVMECTVCSAKFCPADGDSGARTCSNCLEGGEAPTVKEPAAGGEEEWGGGATEEEW